MSLYETLWFFAAYSFLGWVIEVIYHAVCCGKIVNRGFLNGPICPVYGFGILAILYTVSFLPKDASGGPSHLFLFIDGMLIASAIEFLAGYLLDRIYHTRWWDYSDIPFNLGGYICLKFSLLWGLGTSFMVRVVHPTVNALTAGGIPERIGYGLLALIYIVGFSDLIATVIMLRGIARNLKELDRIRTELRKPSEALTRVIGTNAIKAQNMTAELGVQAALAKAELRDASAERVAATREQLELKAAAIRAKFTEHSVFGYGRIFMAFPKLAHHKYRETAAELAEKVRRRWYGSGS